MRRGAVVNITGNPDSDSESYKVTGILEYFDMTSKLWAGVLLLVILMLIRCFTLLSLS